MQAQQSLDDMPLHSWVHATVDVPAGGLERTRAASDEERRAICKTLNLASLERLEARYRISSLAGGGWRLSGSVRANLVQNCVVTLEPVPSAIDESFDVEFWRETGDNQGGEDKSVLNGPDVEPLPDDQIPAGRIVFETLSSSIDPYPRKAGAAFEWQDSEAGEAQKSNPFSVLVRLKDKS